MQAKQTAATTSSTQTTGGIKRTLNLTSLTVNAMALIAPGLFSGQPSSYKQPKLTAPYLPPVKCGRAW